jgi:curli biogenesis system outer membrane secretion channel CsgG
MFSALFGFPTGTPRMRRLSVQGGTLAMLLLIGASHAESQGKQKLRQCDKSLGTLAVVEPQQEILIALFRYNLTSPTSLIRMMAQQSRCFTVVERGIAMQNLMQERALATSGTLQQGSNVGGGQMKAADFILTPAVLFSEGNAGGVGGIAAGVLGRVSPIAGAVAGGLKFKEASTSMLVADTRSGIQVAAAEGKGRKTDFSLGALGIGGGGGAGAGGYTNTNEGKIIAASFLNNFNSVVERMLADGTAGPTDSDGLPQKTQTPFQEGDVLRSKIASIKILASPSDTARVVGTLTKTDEFVFLGQEDGGYLRVQTANTEGWVKAILVTRS